MFLIIGIPSIKLSELAVDLSQRNIFVFILAGLSKTYRNTKYIQMRSSRSLWGQETNFWEIPSCRSSSKQVLRTLGDTFCCRGCVCMCVCEEFPKGRAGRDSGRSSSWVPPTRPAPPLLRDPPSSPCWVPTLLFLYIKGTEERYHPNQKRCDHLRAGSTGPSKVQYHIYIPISLATWSVYMETYAGLWSYPLHSLV